MPPFQGNGFEILIEGPNPNLPHKCTPGCGDFIEKPNDRSGVFLDQKTKKYWIDRKTNSNCFILFSRCLSIIWGDDKSYWKWYSFPERSDVLVDIAELKRVCWFHVSGKFDTSNLTPGVTYEVAFMVMMKDTSTGWNIPVTLELITRNGEQQEQQEHTESMLNKPKGQWMELLVSEFRTDQDKDGEITFTLRETNDYYWKTGIVVKGVIIRPKTM
ncbi:hypothetical protein NE237_008580 [Protea cynaroides]|uniref:Uncharacterized protein n=1 Tax=Protea cynaroides TaxID=273540 RepID=A0A9Q0QZF9_9MAGN|nr:hypothetical protein NE237_008580 [Protea cynaroides]